MRIRKRRGGRGKEGREEKGEGRGGEGSGGREGEGKNELTHPCRKFLATAMDHTTVRVTLIELFAGAMDVALEDYIGYCYISLGGTVSKARKQSSEHVSLR